MRRRGYRNTFSRVAFALPRYDVERVEGEPHAQMFWVRLRSARARRTPAAEVFRLGTGFRFEPATGGAGGCGKNFGSDQ